jgi:hypothetical protein
VAREQTFGSNQAGNNFRKESNAYAVGITMQTREQQ